MTVPAVAPGPPHYTYAASILAVHDGDTVTASIDIGVRRSTKDRDLGLHLHIEGGKLRLHWPVRLSGLNAAELVTPDGQKAQAALAALMPVGSPVVIVTHLDQLEKYGRLLGDIWLADGTHVNQWLIDNGYAVAYDGHGPKPIPAKSGG